MKLSVLSKLLRDEKPTPPVPGVQVGLVAREHAGKTVLLDQLTHRTMQEPLPSGLEFGGLDPRRVAADLRQYRAGERLLRRDGRETTVTPRRHHHPLHREGKEYALMSLRDPVGQILSRVTDRSPGELQVRFRDYVADLASADVLWQILPCPPRNHTLADKERFHDDYRLTTAYVRTALQQRRSERPCVLAVIVNRIDARYDSEADARSRLTREILGWLEGQLRWALTDSAVGAASIFPVSALGFGTTRLLATPERNGSAGGHGDPNNLSWGEPEWVLRPQATAWPYNLKPLVVWSILTGLMHREITEMDDAVFSSKALCRSLSEDLRVLRGWYVPVKNP